MPKVMGLLYWSGTRQRVNEPRVAECLALNEHQPSPLVSRHPSSVDCKEFGVGDDGIRRCQIVFQPGGLKGKDVEMEIERETERDCNWVYDLFDHHMRTMASGMSRE